MKVGDKAKVSPKLTGENDWIEGEIIDVEQNPFNGVVLSLKDSTGRIFFGEEKYFFPAD
ncbi:MAG: hypothetical protein ACLTZX_13065 [Bacteroides ovatus]|jgi:hypothetical protein|uniref:hypothetical protein n=1 Tax=Bacteroides sp. TaxID=29523 RepID=UPI0025E00FBD|nr:hypothetical protein [Prevotella sp.]